MNFDAEISLIRNPKESAKQCMLNSFVSFSKGSAENIWEYQEDQDTYCLLNEV